MHVALKDAISDNDSKLRAGNATDKTLYALGWTIDELSRLNDECHTLYVEVTTLVERLEDEATDVVQMNAARLLNMCQERVRNFIRSITRHKRTAATHVLVTMISPSERNVKPYALPVSCIPYTGLAEGKAHKIINMVVKEMCKRGMKVEGVYQFYPFMCLMCSFD